RRIECRRRTPLWRASLEDLWSIESFPMSRDGFRMCLPRRPCISPALYVRRRLLAQGFDFLAKGSHSFLAIDRLKAGPDTVRNLAELSQRLRRECGYGDP